jgi:RNA polymerase sigma-70 factor (ECF subfamily)
MNNGGPTTHELPFVATLPALPLVRRPFRPILTPMSSPQTLSVAFNEGAGQVGVRATPDLDVSLARYLAAARAAWSEFAIEPLHFMRYVGERAQGASVPPLAHAGDLWLACACVQGAPSAALRFQREHEPLVARLLAKRGASAEIAAEVRQLLAERLLVGDPRTGRQPKIADYKGLGALQSWVAAAAAKTLLSLQRAAGRRREDPEATDEAAFLGHRDPELEYLKRRYSADVHAAFAAALGTLSDRDKALLRLHLVQRLTIDALGAMYQVNRATAARWLAGARGTLRKRTLQGLRTRFNLDAAECDSLIAFVNSQIDISIAEHLISGASKTADTV